MKNMRRVLLKKKNQRDRKKSSNTGQPEVNSPILSSSNRRVSDMPVSLSMHVSPRRESAPIPLLSNTTEAWTANNKPTSSNSVTTPVPKVSIGFVDDGQILRDREGVISITKDVQKFLATISELRQAMEELDARPQAPQIRLLSNDDDDEENGITDNDNSLLENDSEEEEEDEEIMDDRNDDHVIDKLRELAEVVEVCLQSNPGMQSTVLIDASKDLLKTYKNCSHDNSKVCECQQCSSAIDNLVDTFTQCVSDYMIGENATLDILPNYHNGNQGGGAIGSGSGSTGGGGARGVKQLGVPQNRSLGFSKSYDNLAMFSSNLDISQLHDPVIDRIDQALSCVEDPVTVASNYIKFRQKYHRELVGYLNKRAQLEQKYYSQLGRIVKQSQNTLTELEQHKDSLPLVDVFRQSLENDSRYAMNCNTTFNLQVTHKILEPLELLIQEYEKTRKILTNNWLRESKKVVESRSAMKNSKAKYEFFGQELIRVKNLLSNEPVGPKAEKRKREIVDLETKWQESEVSYKDAVAHCNDCQYQVLEMAQKSILCAFRRIIIGFDTALKSGLENYFLLQHNFFRSLPDPLLKDIKETQEYEVGSEFLHFITLQHQTMEELEDYHFEEFDPESDLWAIHEEGSSNKINSDLSRSSIALNTTLETKTGNDRALSPISFDHTSGIKALLQRNETPSPRPDSRRSRPKSMALLDTFASMSSPSFYTTDSPKNSLQRRNSDKSKEALSVSPPLDDVVYSKTAKTHSLKKLRTPARCRGCDTYVYFHGFDCETCGLACHRKCLASLAIRCGSKKLPRKMNVFGIDFHEHLRATKQMIPIIVAKCINEIDSRGLDTQGLYRISSAKSKMEKLCQLFESGSERVDLSELPPHLISSCLKLYFRQLPEPLLTFDMYQEFLTFASEASYLLPCNFAKCDSERAQKAKTLLERLEELVNRLSGNSKLTLARLMYHLNRVSSPGHVRVNCMPASNLGIVFGPNLLRQKVVVPSLALLANMSLQAKAVEIMVAHAHDIFHNIPEEQIIQLEIDSSEDNESNYYYTNEKPVDIIETTVDEVAEMKSDVNESRTPMSTPPERRKQNVEELHEMIEGFANGNLLSPISHRSKSLIMPSPVTASPLLTDSRHWQDPNDTSSLPGCIEENFAESIFNSLDRKFVRPHSTIEKVLTPVMEMRDDMQQGDELSDEGTEILILTASESNTLERQFNQRRRTQSLTKSSSTGFGEESDSVVESDVFHSRTASNASSSNCEPGLYMASRSEDNLSSSYNNETNKVENDFLKFVNECSLEGRLSDSNDSLKYSPFESPDVQALLKPSKPHPISLPNTYPRPTKTSLPPTRQMSEGEIKQRMIFQIGSPPLDSPISFRSIDKSISLASSQETFSEGIVEDILSPSDPFTSKRLMKQNSAKQEEHDSDITEEFNDKDTEKQLAKEKNRPMSIDDIPLPDDSPVISNSKLMKYHHHKHSLSRDSGLSDSPDPFVDLSSSPSHAVNSNVLTDRLAQVTKTQQQMSPLVNRNQVPKQDQLSDNTKRFQELLQNTSTGTKPRPQRLTKHVVKVMRITPSFDSEDLLSPPSTDGEQVNVQRLRMASPDELFNPMDKQIGLSMKRSLSHGEVLKSGEDEIMDTMDDKTRVGDLIISEAKVKRHKISRSEHNDISRSLENILNNF